MMRSISEPAYGVPASDDVSPLFDALRRDHTAALALIERIRTRDFSDVHQLFTALRRHAAGEEETLYTAMAKIPSLAAQSRESWREHVELSKVIETLERTPLGSSDWVQRFNAMESALDRHIAREEQWIFPEAARIFSPQQQRSMAQIYEATMSGNPGGPLQPTISGPIGGVPMGRQPMRMSNPPAVGDEWWVHGIDLDEAGLYNTLAALLPAGHSMTHYGDVRYMNTGEPHGNVASEARVTSHKNGKWFNCKFWRWGVHTFVAPGPWGLQACSEQAGGGQGPDVDIPGGLMADMPFQELRLPSSLRAGARARLRERAENPRRRKKGASVVCYASPVTGETYCVANSSSQPSTLGFSTTTPAWWHSLIGVLGLNAQPWFPTVGPGERYRAGTGPVSYVEVVNEHNGVLHSRHRLPIAVMFTAARKTADGRIQVQIVPLRRSDVRGQRQRPGHAVSQANAVAGSIRTGNPPDAMFQVPRMAPVGPEARAFIDARLPLYFQWLNSLSLEISGEPLKTPLHWDTAEWLGSLAAIAWTGRFMDGSSEYNRAYLYATQKIRSTWDVLPKPAGPQLPPPVPSVPKPFPGVIPGVWG